MKEPIQWWIDYAQTIEPTMILPDYLRQWIFDKEENGVSQRLHNILGPDDPIYHDHPWIYYEVAVLSGGYTEHHIDTDTGKFRRRQLTENNAYIRPGRSPHYIQSVLPDTWTLVTTARKVRDWGFFPDGYPGIWVHHRTFLDSPHNTRKDPVFSPNAPSH